MNRTTASLTVWFVLALGGVVLLINFNILVPNQPLLDRSSMERHHARNNSAPDTTSRDAAGTRWRILCWIMVDPDDLQRRVRHIRDSWTRDCDIRLFMSSRHDADFPAVGLDVLPGRSHIASKSRAAWTYVYEHHFHDADYFVKADPDSYIIVDHLKEYLSNCDPTKSELFGHQFNEGKRGYRYVSGGPGVVLSREAVRRLVTQALPTYPNCFPDGQAEDRKTSGCLHKVGLTVRDTRDTEGKETFLVFKPDLHITGSFPKWYYEYDQNKAKKGPDCCSRYPISFHYLKTPDMFNFRYLLGMRGRPDIPLRFMTSDVNGTAIEDPSAQAKYKTQTAPEKPPVKQ